jgi:hypothetical protein
MANANRPCQCFPMALRWYDRHNRSFRRYYSEPEVYSQLAGRTAKASVISGDIPSTQKVVNAGINCGSLVAISTSSPQPTSSLSSSLSSRAEHVASSCPWRNAAMVVISSSEYSRRSSRLWCCLARSDQVSAIQGIPAMRRRNRVTSIENDL